MATLVNDDVTISPTGGPAERFTSRDPEAFEIPTGRDESWRFSPVDRIRRFFTAFEPDGVTEADNVVPAGAHVDAVEPSSVPAFGSVLEPVDRVSALVMTHATQGLHVRVDAGAELDVPIILRRKGISGSSYVHHIVEAGAGSRATLVIDHVGHFQTAANVEVIVGDGASLSVVVVNDAAPGSVQLSAYAASVGRDATYRHINVTLGGDVVRMVPTARFAGAGGRVEMLGLGFAGPGQHFETRLFVDHSQPDCSSDVLYKNALEGDDARTVWIGDVRIRPAATGTQTFELNRNLVLTDGARADSVPNLEIETGEIASAGHASASGRFDDLQLFYLQSRGIPEHEARRLVVRGFFAEIVRRIGVPEIEERLLAAIEDELIAVV